MGSRLYVGNLPVDVEEREVEDLFGKHGKLKSCYLKGGREGSSRFAFIEFEDSRDADNACRMGDMVRVAECAPLSKTKNWRVVEIVAHAAE